MWCVEETINLRGAKSNPNTWAESKGKNVGTEEHSADRARFSPRSNRTSFWDVCRAGLLSGRSGKERVIFEVANWDVRGSPRPRGATGLSLVTDMSRRILGTEDSVEAGNELDSSSPWVWMSYSWWWELMIPTYTHHPTRHAAQANTTTYEKQSMSLSIITPSWNMKIFKLSFTSALVCQLGGDVQVNVDKLRGMLRQKQRRQHHQLPPT